MASAYSSSFHPPSTTVNKPNQKRSFAADDKAFHTPPGGLVVPPVDPCLSPSAAKRTADDDAMTSPQHSRLACETSTSPLLDAPACQMKRPTGEDDMIPGTVENDTCGAVDPDDAVAVKRKYVEAVAVPASSKTSGKGKKQKTLMVGSIKSYFAMPR
jgi:hypothetical protein